MKKLALLTIDALAYPPADSNVEVRTTSLQATIAYLRFHPEDRPSRERLVKLAIKRAKLPPPVRLEEIKKGMEGLPGAGEHPPEHPKERLVLDTPDAWQVLLELEVLHPGMSVDEAKKLLGPPSGQNEKLIEWVISTPRESIPHYRLRRPTGGSFHLRGAAVSRQAGRLDLPILASQGQPFR